MAYREVRMFEVKEVLRLWLSNVPKKQVAVQLNLDVKTVRRYLKLAHDCGLRREHGPRGANDELVAAVLARLQPSAGRPRSHGWLLCEQNRDFVRKHLDDGVRLTKIRKLLRRKGVPISYPTLYRFAVAELGFSQSEPTIPVADCGPAEEVQVDTGWVGWLEPDLFGKRRRFRAWIFTAVLSRHRFVYPVFRETTETAIEAFEAAWQFYRGIFKAIIVDNTKAIVERADPLKPKLIEGFLEYAQARDFAVDTARVRSPKDKARVERAVRTVREDCFAGERLRDLDQAREHARHWCLEEYGMSRHTRTLRLPLEHFEAEERAKLLPPPTEPYDIPHWCDPVVARDQHAQVEKALYSLPRAFLGRKLRARADTVTVRFYYRFVLVKTHPRVPPGKRSTDPNDFPADKLAYALRDIEFLAKKAESHGEAVGAFARALLAGELPWTRMRRVYALLGLVRRFGDERVNAACQTALAVDMLDVHRLAKMLQIASPPPAPLPSPKIVPIARYLRPTSQFALPLAQPKTLPKGETS